MAAEEKHRSTANSVGVAVVGDQVGGAGAREAALAMPWLGSVLSVTVCGAALSARFLYARDLNPDTVTSGSVHVPDPLYYYRYMKLAPGNKAGIARIGVTPLPESAESRRRQEHCDRHSQALNSPSVIFDVNAIASEARKNCLYFCAIL